MSYFDKRHHRQEPALKTEKDVSPELKKSESQLPNNMADPIADQAKVKANPYGDGNANTVEPSQDKELSQTQQGKDAGERGVPDVRTQKGKTNVSRFFFMVGFVITTLMIILSIFSYFSGSEEEPEEKAKTEEQRIQNNHERDLAAEQERLRLEELARMQKAQEQLAQEKQEQVQAQEQAQSLANNTIIVQQQEQEKTPDRRLLGNVSITIHDSNNNTTPANQQDEGQDTILSNRLVPSITPATTAKQRTNLTYLLRKGANIRCTLDTMIVTTHPGITRCIVNKDIYSANGKTLLIDRGSEIIGEQTTAMVQGQARVFILWTTIETPQGVSIDINSPGSDNLGASGAPSQVDTHFWARFGGAIMLSMIDDVMGIASNRVANKDYTFENTQESSRSMAEEALRNTINIPPTGYVNQGTLLNVMVARDVDFSSVYKLVKLKRY